MGRGPRGKGANQINTQCAAEVQAENGKINQRVIDSTFCGTNRITAKRKFKQQTVLRFYIYVCVCVYIYIYIGAKM